VDDDASSALGTGWDEVAKIAPDLIEELSNEEFFEEEPGEKDIPGSPPVPDSSDDEDMPGLQQVSDSSDEEDLPGSQPALNPLNNEDPRPVKGMELEVLMIFSR
jgi:hypothetical protein